MNARPLAFCLALAAPASAGTVRVEVVPELGAPVAAPGFQSGANAVPLQLTNSTLLPALSLSAPSLTPSAAPSLMPVVPSALVPLKPAASKGLVQVKPEALIKTLAAPALEVTKLGTGESAGAAEKDFNARAQLGAPSALAAGVVSAPSAEEAPKRSFLRLLAPSRKPKSPATGNLASLDGRDHAGELTKAALAALNASPPGTVLALDFSPSPKSLRVISELDYEVFLHRRRSDGRWLLARGDRHGVAGEWEDYDLALHNHPEARMGAYSMHSEYPSPEDLETAAGKDARFFVISKGGVVEWNSATPKGVSGALQSTLLGRFVMRIAFPALYPGHLARSGVAVVHKSWSKVTTDWLESGTAPLNERVLIEKTIPPLVAEELPVIAAKLGVSLTDEHRADVLKRTNGYRLYWHSATTYKDHPDNVGIPDGHFRKDFGIRLMVKPDWRTIPDLAANYKPLFSHEYAHWLQSVGFVSYKYGGEAAAVAVEVLRAIELVGLDEVKAGRAATVHQGVYSGFEAGREWALKGFAEETAPYRRGALAGAAYEAARAAGRPEAAWEFLNLVIAGQNALEPAAAWARVVGSK